MNQTPSAETKYITKFTIVVTKVIRTVLVTQLKLKLKLLINAAENKTFLNKNAQIEESVRGWALASCILCSLVGTGLKFNTNIELYIKDMF